MRICVCHCNDEIAETCDRDNKNDKNQLQQKPISVAFVSTNSICQGEQATALWKPLVERYNVEIDFAYKTFRWDSEASLKAHVHCVIIGFSCDKEKKTPSVELSLASSPSNFSNSGGASSVSPTKTCPQEVGGSVFGVAKDERGLYSKFRLYDSDGKVTLVDHINGYLLNAPDVFIENRGKPLCDVPPKTLLL